MTGLVTFWILAVMAVCFAILMLTIRHPIHAALSLVVTMCCLAGLYLLLASEFIAIMQIIVYAGAIMVLVLYVIMLLQMAAFEHRFTRLPRIKSLMVIMGIILMGNLVYWLKGVLTGGSTHGVYSPERLLQTPGGETSIISEQLFTQYLFPFEVTSLILLVAIVGAIMLASQKKEGIR